LLIWIAQLLFFFFFRGVVFANGQNVKTMVFTASWKPMETFALRATKILVGDVGRIDFYETAILQCHW